MIYVNMGGADYYIPVIVLDGSYFGQDVYKRQVVDVAFRKFEPYGVSGVVVISESHLAIHTWPEYGYAAIDLFTCGDKADPWKAFEYLLDYFKPKRITTMEIKRGNLITTENKNYIAIDSAGEAIVDE